MTLTLRLKLILAIALTLLVSGAITYAAASRSLLRNALVAEEQDARRTLLVARSLVEQTTRAFTQRISSWAQWNDLRDYIVNGDDVFVRANLDDHFLEYAHIDLIVIADTAGRIRYSTGFDAAAKRRTPLTAEIVGRLRVGDLLFGPDAPVRAGKAGIVMLPRGPVLVSAFACTNSESKAPVVGTLISGRFLTRDDIAALGRPVGLTMDLQRFGDPARAAEDRAAEAELMAHEPLLIRPLDADRLVGRALLRDVDGQPAVVLRVEMDRHIVRESPEKLRYLMLVTLLAGLVFGGVMLFALDWLLLRRLMRLSGEVAALGGSKDLDRRVTDQGDDELSRVTTSINGMLETLSRQDRERKEAHESLARVKELSESAHARSERLVRNVLPESVAERLKQQRGAIADHFEEATILFADIVGFTSLAARMSPGDLVALLDRIFSAFDAVADRHGLEKIKTIGDAYMVVGGVPVERGDHVEAVAAMAIDMRRALDAIAEELGQHFEVRIGIHTGPVVAGVIGKQKFSYDLWGDTVNVASRMESHGEPGRIQVTEAVYRRVEGRYAFEPRGEIEVKGKGVMRTYWLLGRPAGPMMASEDQGADAGTAAGIVPS